MLLPFAPTRSSCQQPIAIQGTDSKLPNSSAPMVIINPNSTSCGDTLLSLAPVRTPFGHWFVFPLSRFLLVLLVPAGKTCGKWQVANLLGIPSQSSCFFLKAREEREPCLSLKAWLSCGFGDNVSPAQLSQSTIMNQPTS